MTDSPEFRRQQAEMQELRGFLENTMTEKKQPRAIALANELEIDGAYRPLVRMNAAYLIRRQHALIEELREALGQMVRWMPVYPAAADGIVGGRKAHAAAMEAARAALARAEPQS